MQYRSLIRVKRRMAIPKYVHFNIYKAFGSNLQQYLSFGTLTDAYRAEHANALKQRGFADITQDQRSFLYNKNFDVIFSGLPVEAVNEEDYAPKFDLDLVETSGGFRNHLLAMFPPPSSELRSVWRSTISLLRFIHEECTNKNIRPPQQSPYWLLEHMFQLVEFQK